jgi:hypothetical protein
MAGNAKQEVQQVAAERFVRRGAAFWCDDLSATFTERQCDIAYVLSPLGVKPIKRSQAAMAACLSLARLHLRYSRR